LGYVDGSVTDDEVEGNGSATSFGTFYRVPGWDANLNFVDVTEDFFPRIGFVADRDFRGFNGGVGREIESTTGSLSSVEYGVRVFDYTRRDGSHYREGGSFDIETAWKNLLSVDLEFDYEHFEDRHDKTVGVGFNFPRNNPYRRFGAGLTYGQIEGETYRSVQAGLWYRPVKRLQLSLRAQAVQHTEDEEQIVFNFNFLMNKFESIGGRVVYNEHDWNWFVSYRMGGNAGAEYFLIVGDPNASSFQKTLIFKVSVPFTIG
jgi:hypothetical protein